MFVEFLIEYRKKTIPAAMSEDNTLALQHLQIEQIERMRISEQFSVFC